MSENQEDELLSACIVKGGKKVAVGTQEGVLEIFSWGDWGDCTDRFMGHPCSIDSMVKVDESTICTGTSDGKIRMMSIQPNKFIKVLGEHDEELPIENLHAHPTLPWVLSCSSQEIRFWNTEDVGVEDEEDSDSDADSDEPTKTQNSEEDDSDSDDGEKKTKRKKNKISQKNFDKEFSKKSFFSGID